MFHPPIHVQGGKRPVCGGTGCSDQIVTGQADIQVRFESRPRFEKLYYTAVYGWTSPHWRMLAWQSTLRAEAKA